MLRPINAFFLALPLCSAILKGINYYGIETETKKPVCNWVHNPDYYIPLLKEKGFNTLRVPFSGQYVREGDFGALDNMLQVAKDNDVGVILDYHRNFNTHQGATPEEGGLTIADFIAAWVTVLLRYQGNDHVWAVGVYNEYQGQDNVVYWNGVLNQTISAIERMFPGRFSYLAGYGYWGGNCRGIDLSKEPYWNRTYIELHKYSFSGPTTEADWDDAIGSFPERVIIGEMGWFSEVQSDVDWANRFLAYLKKRGIQNLCFWTLAQSHDTGGILKDDCLTWEDTKLTMLHQFWDEEEPICHCRLRKARRTAARV